MTQHFTTDERLDRLTRELLIERSKDVAAAAVSADAMAERIATQGRPAAFGRSRVSEAPRAGLLSGVIAPAMVIAVVVALLVLVPLVRQPPAGELGASPSVSASIVPQQSSSIGVRFDPIYTRVDDTLGVIDESIPEPGSAQWQMLRQLRAAWVDGKFCHALQFRDLRSGELRQSSGYCATWDELNIGGVISQYFLTVLPTGNEQVVVWAVLAPDVARVEVTLQSGEIIEPALLPVGGAAQGQDIRLVWIQTLSPAVDVLAYNDADQSLPTRP